MAFNGKYEYDQDGIDKIISEKGDYFLALREVRWSSDKDFKNDLRRYKSDEEGDIALKGCSFNDDEADELVLALIDEGFGDNDELANAIVENRPDLAASLKSIFSDNAKFNFSEDSRRRLFQRRQKDDEIDADENGRSLDEYYDPRKDLFEESA